MKIISYLHFFILIRKKYYFLDSIRRFFALNKGVVTCVLLLLLTGVFTGLFCVFKIDAQKTISMLPDFLFKKYIINSSSFFAYFFFKSLFYCVVFFILYFLTYLKIGYFVIIPVIFMFSFLLGKTVGVLLCVYPGYILMAILFLLIEFLLLFLAIVFLLRFLNFNKQLAVYGNCYIRGIELKIVLTFFAICVSILLIETILLFTIGKIFL